MITTEMQQALQSPDEDIRLQALVNLEPPTPSERIDLLVAMLGDESWRVRKAVVQVLVKTDINRVVPLLTKTLSVGNIGPKNVSYHNSALECLTEIGRPAIPDLTNALQDSDKDVRIAAANALGSIRHHDACDALIHALHDPHINVRYAAVEALSRIPSQKSVIPLTQVLKQDDDWLKLPAISALGSIGDYRATPYLIDSAGDPLLLQTVVEALGHIGDERGIPCIINALDSPDKEIRKTAVMSMESMACKLDKLHTIIQQPSTYRSFFRSACTEDVMPYLIEFTDETDFHLAVSSIKLLGWSGRQDAAYALLGKLENEAYLEVAVSALIHIGTDAIAPLISAYEESYSLDTKLLILDCLWEIGGEQVLQHFLTLLETSDEESIVYALLKSLGTEQFVSPILETRKVDTSHHFKRLYQQTKHHLESAHPLIRAEAISLWGKLLGEEAFDDLFNAAQDIEPTIRMKAIECLGQLVKHHPDQLQQLTLLLSDDHPNIRKQVARALGNADDPAAFLALLLVLDDMNPTVQRAAVLGLGNYLTRHPEDAFRRQVLDKLTDVLENRCRRYEDGLLKIETCRILQQIETERSQALLLKLAHDPDFDVRKSAILALGTFQTFVDCVAPVIQEFLEDAHWSVREAAVTAIGLLHAQNMGDRLLQMWDDPDFAVQKALHIALGRLGSLQALPLLIEHLAHDELDDAAYQGLTMLATRYREQIAAYGHDENPKVHMYLQHILGIS
ncbi:hypothetical protein CSA56_18095 [candidate division KSB3 bacterium]|uniref:TOG domain-containing protein n=1 Tax=candidate division KSB3 bacterium TaxID=2044937 RepID=A0A2G6K757_9BACT|nr:MAG: hypothetical protein CSA56_18095 [candidate division KSB3 bacterium]